MNIPDSLLFQMSPITSLGFLEYTYAGIYFLCLFFIWLVYFYSTPTHKEIPSLGYREALLPHSEDERFEMLLLHYIKDRLQKNFSGSYLPAHTVSEIERYISDTALIEMLHDLEDREYSGESIDIQERVTLLQKVQKMLS